jgi:hypothetical protein
MAWSGPVTPLGDGRYRVRLERAERAALARLCDELRGLIEAEDGAAARLFPAAYRDDPEASVEYDRLVRGGLVAGRLAALATVERTIDAKRLAEDELEAWCGALNDVRLVLGERLGVTEELYERELDPNDPRAPELALYAWLTWLQGWVVEALSSRL